MRFQVPQFIEIEDKIFGPLTLKQFIYLAGGGGAVFILYATLPLVLTMFFGIPIAILALAMAFYQIHGQPFIKVMENAFHYITSNRLYLWKKREIKKSAAKPKEQKTETLMYMPKPSQNKLEDLSWSLDIKEKVMREGQQEE